MDKKFKTVACSNLVGALVFIVLGIWAWIQTSGFQTVKGTYVQPSLFSRIMIIGMLIFSLVLLIQSVYKLMTMKEDDLLARPAASIHVVKDKSIQAALAVIVLCIGFVALLDILGYVICSALISIAIMYLIGKRNLMQMVLVSVLVPVGMWFLFYKVLTVNIPMGPLSILRDLVDKI